MAQKLIMPINDSKITVAYKKDALGYHEKNYGHFHYGIDIVGMDNTLYASGNGIVVSHGGEEKAGLGFFLCIQYDDALDIYNQNIGSVLFRYCHLAYKPDFMIGKTVDVHQPIGTYWNISAKSKMQPHLHLEVDSDIENPYATPTLIRADGGLIPCDRINDTTMDPLRVLHLKKSKSVCQNVIPQQKYCKCHGYGYVNIQKVKNMPVIA